jgi:hypothetical protein
MQKKSRWYAVIDDAAHIYDHWLPSRSTTVSIVSLDQLAYYRANFHLRKAEAE